MKERIEYPAYPEVFLDVLFRGPEPGGCSEKQISALPDFADMISRKLSFMVLRQAFWRRRSKGGADQSRLGQDPASM